VVYPAARSSAPSDSFPGLLALVTGGRPIDTGVIYDDSFDRTLSPPGSTCTTKGTAVVFDEVIDRNPDAVDGGGGIDEAKLPRDPAHGCAPVYPHAYLRVNTVFDVVKAAGGRTAWGDKHLAYDLVRGPTGTGVDDLVTPEIAAGKSDTVVDKSLANDEIRVQAMLNEIAGKGADGTGSAAVPKLFGLNFESVSVGQKYGGYLDAQGTPGPDLAHAMESVDAMVGRLVAALDTAGLTTSTLVIVTAKHGQSPIDPAAKRIVNSKAIAPVVNSVAPDLLAAATLDDVGLIWLKDSSKAPAVAKALLAAKADLGIDRVIVGKALWQRFGDPAQDPRAPDLAIETVHGVIYTKPTATKIAEHGGFSDDDRSVVMIAAAPGGHAVTVDKPVATQQVAPTILRALGLDLGKLDALRHHRVAALPKLAG
jgi:hypothetical protein